MHFVYNDGGRALADFRGKTGDCVCRSIAIAAQLPYQEVYDALNAEARRERPRKGRAASSARNGVYRATIRRYLESLGWEWTPTMAIGSGCRVHLRAGELPHGRLIVSVSKHLTAVIYGVIHDTQDPSRGGTRCVYGYWSWSRKIRDDRGKSVISERHTDLNERGQGWIKVYIACKDSVKSLEETKIGYQ